MPLSADVVGTDLGSIDVTIDARWLMAYAADVPDDRPEMYDTASRLRVHPLFPVAVEWQHIVRARPLASGLTADEARRGIHAGHDVMIRRQPRPDETVRLSASVVAVGRRRAGATQAVRFDATTGAGESLWQTTMTSLFLGVDLIGEPRSCGEVWPPPPEPPVEGTIESRRSFVRSVDAHVYSECARIWNPIHTDVVAARAVGLDAPILHGTATLARAVSAVVDMNATDIGTVMRVTAAFRAPVALDAELTVRLRSRHERWSMFDVLRADGVVAVSGALVADEAVGDQVA